MCENPAGSSLVAGLRRIAVPAAVALTNYAGTAPIPRASRTRYVVLACYARSRATWGRSATGAFCSLRGSPGAWGYVEWQVAR